MSTLLSDLFFSKSSFYYNIKRKKKREKKRRKSWGSRRLKSITHGKSRRQPAGSSGVGGKIKRVSRVGNSILSRSLTRLLTTLQCCSQRARLGPILLLAARMEYRTTPSRRHCSRHLCGKGVGQQCPSDPRRSMAWHSICTAAAGRFEVC